MALGVVSIGHWRRRFVVTQHGLLPLGELLVGALEQGRHRDSGDGGQKPWSRHVLNSHRSNPLVIARSRQFHSHLRLQTLGGQKNSGRRSQVARNLEKANARIERNNHHHSACIMAAFALSISILREIYQKQITVTAIFRNNFSNLTFFESFLMIASSISISLFRKGWIILDDLSINRMQVKSK
jgi:hypothetical protein